MYCSAANGVICTRIQAKQPIKPSDSNSKVGHQKNAVQHRMAGINRPITPVLARPAFKDNALTARQYGDVNFALKGGGGGNWREKRWTKT